MISNKTKIFIVRPTMGQGGADRVTLALLKGLDRQKYAISIVLMRREGEYANDIPTDVAVYDLNQPNMWAMPLPTARLFRQHNPDIIFSTSSGTNPLVCIAHKLARQNGRLVLSESNLVFHGEYTLKRRFMVWLKRLAYRRADLVTAISACLADDLAARLKISRDKLYVVYNPVVEDEISTLAQLPVSHPWFEADVPVILGVGRLVAQKDFGTLIRAFHVARQRRPLRLLILGEGEKRPYLEQLIASLNLQEDVALPGFDKNPFRYMANCAIFAQTPVHEGLGNVLIQAMACGAPVISTDCPCGPSEIIAQDGEDGFLTPVGDVDAVAQRINFLLDNPHKRQQMAAAGQKSAARFQADLILARYAAAIEGTI